jgi:hypothetical protein
VHAVFLPIKAEAAERARAPLINFQISKKTYFYSTGAGYAFLISICLCGGALNKIDPCSEPDRLPFHREQLETKTKGFIPLALSLYGNALSQRNYIGGVRSLRQRICTVF